MKEFICYFIFDCFAVNIITLLVLSTINYFYNTHLVLNPIICVVIPFIFTILHMIGKYL